MASKRRFKEKLRLNIDLENFEESYDASGKPSSCYFYLLFYYISFALRFMFFLLKEETFVKGNVEISSSGITMRNNPKSFEVCLHLPPFVSSFFSLLVLFPLFFYFSVTVRRFGDWRDDRTRLFWHRPPRLSQTFQNTSSFESYEHLWKRKERPAFQRDLHAVRCWMCKVSFLFCPFLSCPFLS